jgi:hypothetical protein
MRKLTEDEVISAIAALRAKYAKTEEFKADVVGVLIILFCIGITACIYALHV